MLKSILVSNYFEFRIITDVTNLQRFEEEIWVETVE